MQEKLKKVTKAMQICIKIDGAAGNGPELCEKCPYGREDDCIWERDREILEVLEAVKAKAVRVKPKKVQKIRI